jgi:hypothetical protein
MSVEARFICAPTPGSVKGRRAARRRPAVEHVYLPAAAFLRGGPEYGDGEPELVGHARQAGGGADRAGSDDVVAAGVTEPGQRVVFGADPDVQIAGTDAGGERGGQLAGAAGDRVAEAVQLVGKPARGPVLLPGNLGWAWMRWLTSRSWSAAPTIWDRGLVLGVH